MPKRPSTKWTVDPIQDWTLTMDLERATEVEATQFKNFEGISAVSAEELATQASIKTK